MGSEKYPDAKEYREFIKHNSGGTNAWTSGSNTNYYFNIDKNHFEKALDMLA